MQKIINTFLKKILGLSHPQTVGSTNEQTREKWVEATLKKVPPGSRILDAGAGEQPFRKYCGHLHYVCQDFSQYDPTANGSGLQRPSWNHGALDIISDIASIPEKDQSFDAILCTEVFEHIINPRDALREFSRLLKPGGHLLLTAPFSSLTHFAPYHYYSGFSQFFYEKELPANGFAIVEIVANGNYFEFVAQEINRLNSVAAMYSHGTLTRRETVAAKLLLKGLQRFSDEDSGSSTLLNLGYHILSQKSK